MGGIITVPAGRQSSGLPIGGLGRRVVESSFMGLRIFVLWGAGQVGDLPHGGAEVNSRRRRRGSAGFVWRFLFFDGGGRFRLWRGGLGGSGFLQFAESGVGLVMGTLMTGFVA